MKKLVYLSLGSNLGDRRANLEHAVEKLRALGDVKGVSSFYETAPVEFTQQPDFLNIAVALETEKMPKQLMAALLGIEQEMGRRRPPAALKRTPENAARVKGPRTIDIDIIFFGRSVLNIPGIKVPHPAMSQRRFVLEPLAEIAPEARHPVLKKTVRELRDALGAGGGTVRR